MATTLASQVQELYIGYLGRAADKAGLDFWVKAIEDGTSTLESVALGFTQSAEYQAAYANLTNTQLVAHVYQNVLGRAADADGLTFWVGEINKGVVSADTLVKAMINSLGSIDQLNMDNKVQAANEYTQAAGDNYVLADAKTAIGAPASNNPGQTYTLTTGIDTLTGGAGNDTFNATETAAAGKVLGGLDVIDGGAGTDTLNVDNSQAAAAFSFAGATIKNVENINVTTNGNFDGLDISGIAGLTTFKGTAADTAATTLTAADTTNVNLTLATTSASTVTGGQAVSVTKGATAAGTLGVTGKGLTEVTLKGGAGVVSINNQENSVAATANKGTTLKTVTLDGVDANSGIGGEGLESVTVKGATTAARTVTITNAKVDHALTVNVDGTGYTAAGAATSTTTVVDAAAKTITVNATGAKSNVALTGSTSATTVNVTGSADLTLAALASATKIDGSAATGGLTLGDLSTATVNVSTGAGKDSFAIQATTKVTANAGAGDDTVTLKSGLVAGSTLNLGAGNDKLLNSATGSVATSTATAVTVIDAGDGTDTVSAALINAGNAGQFKNFESLDISAAANLDVALMTGSTITGLTLTGGSAASTVNNVAAGAGLSVSGDNTTGAHTINVKDAATGTADSFAVTFDGAAVAGAAATAANIKAGTVVLEGVETVSIASTGAANTWNSIALTDGKLQTVAVTGEKNLDLTFVGTNGTNVAATGGAVKLIDGSAATGKLSINTTNVTADDKAGVGLTVKGGSANDTITLAQKATVVAGAGDDTIVSSANGGTFTGGEGKDVFNVKAAVGNVTTITDFVVGTDKLAFADHGAETFTATKVDISAATNLTDALNLAAAADGSTNTAITWFQYGADTYVVADATAATTYTAATDVVVKLTGLVDLSTQTVADFNFVA